MYPQAAVTLAAQVKRVAFRLLLTLLLFGAIFSPFCSFTATAACQDTVKGKIVESKFQHDPIKLKTSNRLVFIVYKIEPSTRSAYPVTEELEQDVKGNFFPLYFSFKLKKMGGCPKIEKIYVYAVDTKSQINLDGVLFFGEGKYSDFTTIDVIGPIF